MSSSQKRNSDQTLQQQGAQDMADRIEAAMLLDRIKQASAMRGELCAGALLVPTKILTKN